MSSHDRRAPDPAPDRICPHCDRVLRHEPSSFPGEGYDAQIDNYNCDRCLIGWYGAHPDGELQRRGFVAEDVSLSHTLVDAIDRTDVTVAGKQYRLTFVGAKPAPAHPQKPIAVAITVRTTDAQGTERRAEVVLSPDHVDDDEYVLDGLRTTMTEVLDGSLQPHERRIL